MVNGIVDFFFAHGIPTFGPNKKAALSTEGSKISCKKLLTKARVPTAQHFVPKDFQEALHYINNYSCTEEVNLVIKANGLCAGKGVTICKTKEQAIKAVTNAMELKIFGEAGEKVLIEERLYGHECSFMVLTDGVNALPFITAQDYKHEFDGGKGQMTGGMGAFAPTSLISAEVDGIMETIVMPFIKNGLLASNIGYNGLLYFGLMITDDGPYVLEINCRFGDPETQVVLPLLKTDLCDLLWASTFRGGLEKKSLEWVNMFAVGVVLAAPGYPIKPEIGMNISNLVALECAGVDVFYAGIKDQNHIAKGCYMTSGGRVMTVVGYGETLDAASRYAYLGADMVEVEGGVKMRNDIGKF